MGRYESPGTVRQGGRIMVLRQFLDVYQSHKSLRLCDWETNETIRYYADKSVVASKYKNWEVIHVLPAGDNMVQVVITNLED